MDTSRVSGQEAGKLSVCQKSRDRNLVTLVHNWLGSQRNFCRKKASSVKRIGSAAALAASPWTQQQRW
jgi:hypothetical protein